MIDELLEENQIRLFIFPKDMWDRLGFYFPDNRTIYVNEILSEDERKRVILHELGHINHNPALYKRLLYTYENQADRFMIRCLLEEEFAEYGIDFEFNWLNFAKRHHIPTTWGEVMIKEEYKKIVGLL